MPWALVWVSNLTLVTSEIRVTAAPGTTAPCGSTTRPPMVARTSCASPGVAATRQDREAKSKASLFIGREAILQGRIIAAGIGKSSRLMMDYWAVVNDPEVGSLSGCGPDFHRVRPASRV